MGLFSKKSIGLDIADHTVEVTELVSVFGKIKPAKAGRCLLEPGIVEHGRIVDAAKLKPALQKLFASAKPGPLTPRKIIFGLPDSQVYTHVFSVSKPLSGDLNTIIFDEAKSNIPLEETDLLFAYDILEETKDKIDILLAAASRETVSEWQKFFASMSIEVKLFDLEPLALGRGLGVEKLAKPVAIVDIGSTESNINIFIRKKLNYSFSSKTAGDYFTRQIAVTLGLIPAEAEKRKINIGLGAANDKMNPVILAGLENIKDDILRALDYFEKKTGQKVGGVIFVGGSSQMKGLLDYFNKELGRPCILGVSDISRENIPLEYLEAAGLALRDLGHLWENDPAFKPVALVKEEKIEKKIIATESQAAAAEPAAIGAVSGRIDDGGSSEDKELSASLRAPMPKNKLLRSQLLLLMDVLIVGAVLVGAAFLYRNYNNQQQLAAAQKNVVQYNFLQTFNFKVPVAVNSLNYAADNLHGRVIKNTINSDQANNYSAATLISMDLATKDLKTGEALYGKPLSELTLNENSSFPINFEWLVYSEKDLIAYVTDQVNKINVNNIPYFLNSVEKTNLETTNDANIFDMDTKVGAYVNELMNK